MIESGISGVAGIIILLVLILVGCPVWLALISIGFWGTVAIIGFEPSLGLLATTPYFTVASFGFVVLPMFILMGTFAVHAGIGERMYTAARTWVGRLHGGLAMATTMACALFSVVTGSAIATTATFTRVALPEMRKCNYDDKLSTAVIASSGTLAVLIPPSAVMVFFSMITETSLGKLMLGGFIPGFLSAIIYMIMIYIRARIDPKLGPPLPQPIPWKERILASRWLLPVGTIVLVMLGGIYLGVFSPSEAGAIGAFCTFIAALIRRSLTVNKMLSSLLDTVKTTAMILFILFSAITFGKFLGLSGFTAAIIDFFVSLPAPPIVTVILILLAYIAGGCVMPAMAMLAFTLPVVFPLLTDGLGYDPVWVGIICIKILEIAAITPPVGLHLFAVKAAAGSVSLGDVIRGIFPFFVMDVLTLAILVAFPIISLWLPQQMF